MSNSRILSVKPIIHYPRVAQVGKTYLMTIDLEVEAGAEWQYEEEEYPIYCTVDSELFSSKPVGEPVIVLHRFGGSYGEARFLLTAVAEERRGNVKVALINAWGVVTRIVNLEGINLLNQHDSDKIDDFREVESLERSISEEAISEIFEGQKESENTKISSGLAVLLTSLPVEYMAVRQHLTNIREELHPQGMIYEQGEFIENENIWKIIIMEIGVGNIRTAVGADRAISYFKPDVLMLIGIAGGIKDVQVGDVVVATEIYNYEAGRSDTRFLPRPEVCYSSYSLVQRAKAIALKSEWVRRLPSNLDAIPRVFLTPMASGEKVLTSSQSDLFSLLSSSYAEATAIEMDGFGFLSAANGHVGIQSIVIRGIADVIDQYTKDDSFQIKAAEHASAFAFEILANLEPIGQNERELISDSSGQFIPGSRCRKMFGHEELTMKVLSHFQAKDTTPIVCLGSVAGYGKTEVATEVAKVVITQSIFEDVAWVAIRESELSETFVTANRSSELVQWQDVLYDLSRQLNCPADRESVQMGLHDRRWLVVLDNAEVADLNDILPRLVKMLGTSRALLTSRVNTPFPFVKVMDCPGLSAEASRALLMNEAAEDGIEALLSASEAQMSRLYQLSCGAPLALHFIVGRARDNEMLDPLLDALEGAKGEVELFYRFALETAWQRLSDRSKQFIRYMAHGSVSPEELQNVFQVTGTEVWEARTQLKRWSMILSNGGRDDLHPWVRCIVRGNLTEKWDILEPEEIREEDEEIAYVEVCLDDDMPDYMMGIFRCGHVVSKNGDGDDIKEHDELIDNTEYHSLEELKEDVARRLNVNPSIIEIFEYDENL
jgi:nucleoside phosphorylase